jgi:hypothetical protein
MRKTLTLAAAVALALSVAAPALASDFSNGKGATAAPNWKVYEFNASGQAYSSNAAAVYANGIGFDFLNRADTALITTKQDKTLLGNLTGASLSATFTIVGTDAAFTYYGSPGACGLNGPNVRLYFEGNTNGPFTYDTAGYAKYWWSNPGSYAISDVYVGGTTVTLTVPLDTAYWSDWGGELAASVPNYFAAAVRKVSAVGLSFGGGCFFANGVGVTAGSASFVLTSFSVIRP